eukprot:NODE_523_length_6504_cov_0.524434.p7 type:complete len:113 gc:universal NODE_523_length_6504_cov_0.524434:1417-1755(+)
MLQNGVIKPSKSNWRAAVVMLSKPAESVRFCINYKPPLPNLQSLINSIDGAKFFISRDLKSGYWQSPLADNDREKTAFVTPFGLFEFIAMPFGLSTAPASFQRLTDYRNDWN